MRQKFDQIGDSELGETLRPLSRADGLQLGDGLLGKFVQSERRLRVRVSHDSPIHSTPKRYGYNG